MRKCKICQKTKEYNYLCLNSQGRATYKDEDGIIWHSRTCGPCHAAYVRSKAGKEPLKVLTCECGQEFKQKVINQKTCSNHY
jgi:hypothetical protein